MNLESAAEDANDADLNPSEGAGEMKQETFTSDVTVLLKDSCTCCDILWSLFVAAARSYRFSSVLHPFPPMYRVGNEEEKNMFALREAITRVPKLNTHRDFLSSLPSDCQDLLSWVLSTQHFHLQLKEKGSTFRQIRELTGQVMGTSEPTYVFEVVPSMERERKFKQLQGTRKSIYAYHGSRLDNFFSILHNGLYTHINKVAVFGEGTYLSSELSVSLMYSQGGEGWKHSCLGARLSCVAVCEMIDDPGVKCQVKEGSAAQQRQRAQASKSTDAVPEKYYVVQNRDVIRVKYLLVYKEEGTCQPLSTVQPSSFTWLRDHKFTLLMLAYVLVLVAIGLSNSRQTVNSLMRFYKNIKFS